MNDLAIQAHHLGKLYRIGYAYPRHDTLRDMLASGVRQVFRRRPRPDTADDTLIWALNDVSFDVPQGQVVGIIGSNGAGKSTLLKILTRVTEPTCGEAGIHGRVGSLLEVGTGFHPELTGKENIYLNGALIGMSRSEIRRKFDAIVEFSEITRFLDTPVKHYSSGMYVRLAFAVAAHLEPEILLVDEVLAVGDVAFQKKCLGKMSDVGQDGRTVLFVSHNMTAIQNLCSRAMLFQHGRLVQDGPVDDVVTVYLQGLEAGAAQVFNSSERRAGAGKVRLTGARVLDGRLQPAVHLVAGTPVTFQFDYANPGNIRQANVTFTVYNHLGVPVTNCDMVLTGFSIQELGATGTFACQVPNLPLPVGRYRIAAAVQVNGTDADRVSNAIVFDVRSSKFYSSGIAVNLRYCSCMIPHHWTHRVTDSQIRKVPAEFSQIND